MHHSFSVAALWLTVGLVFHFIAGVSLIFGECGNTAHLMSLLTAALAYCTIGFTLTVTLPVSNSNNESYYQKACQKCDDCVIKAVTWQTNRDAFQLENANQKN